MKKYIQQIQEKITGMNQKTRYYVLGGVVAGVLLIDILFVMVPQVMTISKLTAKSTTHTDNLLRLKNNQARLGQYHEQVRTLTSNIEENTNVIRSEEEVPLVLEQISRMAKDYNIQIDQVMPLTDTKQQLVSNEDGIYHAMSISINARGGYHAFGRFLNAMEINRVFLRVQQLSIENVPRQIERHDINLVIDVVLLEKTT